MKRYNKANKKFVLFGLVIPILVFFISYSAVYAYFTSKTYNEVTSQAGIVSINFQEDENNKKTSYEIQTNSSASASTTIMPGDTLIASSTIVNEGNVDVYAIFHFFLQIEKTNGEIENSVDTFYSFNKAGVVSRLTSINGLYTNEACLLQPEDAVDVSVSKLFNGATYNNSYKNAKITFIFTAYAIQVSGINSAINATNLLVNLNNENYKNIQLFGNSTQNIINLPAEYQQVEFIQSSKTQYISTGVIPNENTGFEVTFLSNDSLSNIGHGCIFGARTSFKSNDYELSTYSYDTITNGSITFGSLQYSAGLQHQTKTSTSLINKTYTTSLGTNTVISNSETFEAPCDITIFALNQNGSKTQHGNVKLYSLKLYDGNTLVRDYIPCYRVADEEIGLYDLVNNTFSTNEGSGSFTKGLNVNAPSADHPLEIISVGERTKNLFNKNNLTNFYADGSHKVWENSGIYSSIINIDPNKNYTISMPYTTTMMRVAFLKDFPALSVEIYRANGVAGFDTFDVGTTTLSNIALEMKYMIVTFWRDTTTNYTLDEVASKIQIQEGSTATTYEPYGYKIPVKVTTSTETEYKNIYLDQPLRKVGDYADYIDFATGNVVRNVRALQLAIAEMNNTDDNCPGWTSVPYINSDFANQNTTFNTLTDVICNISATGSGVLINTENKESVLLLDPEVFTLTKPDWLGNYPNLILEICYNINAHTIEAIDLSSFDIQNIESISIESGLTGQISIINPNAN